jgi:hypothetical protein
MGRPIKKKYFGNTNAATTGEGVGGEGVATIAKNNTGTLYTTSTTIGLTFTAPQIAGGQTASGSVTTNALGNVATVTLTDGGSGYTSAPTATVTGGTTGTVATFTYTMTSSRQNGIKFDSYIPAAAGGTAAVSGGDIVKQEGSHAYLVKNSEGTGICRLVTTSALAAGQMNIVATDVNGSTYYVKKLTAHKAVLVQSTASGSFEVANNAVSAWTLGSAATGVVSITNN